MRTLYAALISHGLYIVPHDTLSNTVNICYGDKTVQADMSIDEIWGYISRLEHKLSRLELLKESKPCSQRK